jgi:hypothetical protein
MEQVFKGKPTSQLCILHYPLVLFEELKNHAPLAEEKTWLKEPL